MEFTILKALIFFIKKDNNTPRDAAYPISSTGEVLKNSIATV